MKLTATYNGHERSDGYDALMRPVNRSDNAPGGVTHLVRYISVQDGHIRILWCDSAEEATRALRGPAADAVGDNDLESIYEDCPDCDDTVNCCPDCERPNQFGELCASCARDQGVQPYV